jgi:hypothetical protein
LLESGAPQQKHCCKLTHDELLLELLDEEDKLDDEDDDELDDDELFIEPMSA